MVKHIQQLVEQSLALERVERENLVFLPTGDGMIIWVCTIICGRFWADSGFLQAFS
jgi:hypothetical protein